MDKEDAKKQLEKSKLKDHLEGYKKRDEEHIRNNHPENYTRIEADLTEKDKQIIDWCDQITDEFVSYYGGEPEPCLSNQIAIVNPGGLKHLAGKDRKGGAHSVLGQHVVVDKISSEMGMAVILIHELFHLKNHKSIRFDKQKEIKIFRSGLEMEDSNGKERFNSLEEAVVAESALLIYSQKIKNDPLFKEELDVLNQIKAWVKELPEVKQKTEEQQQLYLDSILAINNALELVSLLKDKSTDYRNGYLGELLKEKYDSFLFASRNEEIQKLHELMDLIVEKSQGRFTNRQEVFDEFARANYSGDIARLSKMINDILGEGSFRKLSYEF